MRRLEQAFVKALRAMTNTKFIINHLIVNVMCMKWC